MLPLGVRSAAGNRCTARRLVTLPRGRRSLDLGFVRASADAGAGAGAGAGPVSEAGSGCVPLSANAMAVGAAGSGCVPSSTSMAVAPASTATQISGFILLKHLNAARRMSSLESTGCR
jgi:hypothetical protein